MVYGDAASVTISGAIIVQNLLEQFDEASTGWTGTCTGTAIIGGNLQLAGSGNILAAANILTESDILDFGGLGNGGTYTVPSAHIINAQRVTDVGIAISWSAEAVSIYDNLLTTADLFSVNDILGTDNGPTVSVTPQIQMAQATGGYSAWQNFAPGRYTGQYFNFQLVLDTTDPTVNCVVTDFAVMTDVPDLIYTGTNVSVPTGGLTVSYPTPFNNTPNVQVTIQSASAGDDAVLTKTTGGFTVQIMNTGSGVARTIDWAAQGF